MHYLIYDFLRKDSLPLLFGTFNCEFGEEGDERI